MKRVFVGHFSVTGTTETMAEYIAEGVRMSGQEAVVKKIADIEKPDDLLGYDGYIFGAPTHFRDIPQPVKAFLTTARQPGLKGKLAGAFGSYTHDGNAPALILDTLEHVYQMEPFRLGALNLKEIMLEQPRRDEQQGGQYVAGEIVKKGGEGIRACQDYGRVFAETLGA